ncbi:carotenoid oxygenase family protein [Microscilla marina]|uniref:Retinal pigment epithelial membrane protein n=1 Tax=Microscilla marina ATCC 23134 TaxID=313606 RepID=A1ZH42_MICM2|nr:carotenoid oxygenase family protein [Microscilla marina]EAY30311.1 retinal pigment epithelial membrane protein [Microscilla marina ATCC 23134]
MKNDIMNYALEMANPYLLGPYAPVFEEIVADNLEVIGEIPQDIHGTYVRNGPNPRFEPEGHYHWFDGDGMLHAIQIENGKAIYRNRWIRTSNFKEETQAEKSLWQGLMGRFSANKDRPWNRGVPLKDTANTAVAYHNGKLLAGWYMCGDLYAIDPVTLETKGVESFGGTLQSKAMAHVKVDEHSNEMMFFDYELTKAYIAYGVVDGTGKVTHFTKVKTPGPRVPHDMAITENHSILMDLPLIYDLSVMVSKGKAAPVFQRELPSRFGILPRFGTADQVCWFEAKPCYIYHTINAWEEGDEIIMDCCINPEPTPQKKLPPNATPEEKLNAYLRLDAHLYRYHFNMKTGQTREYALDDRSTEFPLMNSQYLGRKSRFAYNQHLDLSEKLRFDGIVKYDTQKQTAETHWYGDGVSGSESPFIPKPHAKDEDDGYVISFVTDARTDLSEVIILDAKNIADAPLARIKLPQRVPLGFHACWVNSDRIFN